MMQVNVARFLERSQAEGPGWRSVIWVQGCPILCKGCINQEMLPFVDRHWLEVETLSDRILAIKDIEGVTFVGGEPFAQAQALGELAKRVRQHGLSIMTFTGYTLDELHQKKESGIETLLNQTDLLLAGPFIQERFTDGLPWIGSDNQQYHFLTDRYRYLERQIRSLQINAVEIRFTADELHMNGLLHIEMLKFVREALKKNDIQLTPRQGKNCNE